MHINLINHNNIEGKGLSVLLGNEGHQVEFLPQQEQRMNKLPSSSSSSVFLINVDFLLADKADQLLEKITSHHTILLFGELCQLHWLAQFPSRKKGFICKHSTFPDLLKILHGVGNQQLMLDQHARLFLQKSKLGQQTALLQKKLTKPLSNAELALMRETSKGKTTKEIAGEQYLSVHTVYNHRKNIKQKFQSSETLKLSKFCMLHKDAIRTLILIDNEQFA